MHLVNNLLVQIVLGVLLEMVHRWRIILIYLAGVAAGALANSLFLPTYYLAGASGGVYAVEYAHLSNVILVSRGDRTGRDAVLPDTFVVRFFFLKSRQVILIPLGMDFVYVSSILSHDPLSCDFH